MAEIRVFISHSSGDAGIAEALARLLQAGLALSPEEIRCTSASGYGLPAGVEFDDVLRTEITAARAFIGLVTPESLGSSYVLFELGARWGAGLQMVPLLARGSRDAQLPGPLARLHAMTAYEGAQLHQLLNDVATQLGGSVKPAQYYDRELQHLLALGSAPRSIPLPPPVLKPLPPPPGSVHVAGPRRAGPASAQSRLVATLRTLCERAAVNEYDIYTKSELPDRFLGNARRPNGYVTSRDKLIALISNSTQAQDGLAILESGISWRNDRTQSNVRLTWHELAALSIRANRDKTISIGPTFYLDLNGGDADQSVVAGLLRRLVKAATAAAP